MRTLVALALALAAAAAPVLAAADPPSPPNLPSPPSGGPNPTAAAPPAQHLPTTRAPGTQPEEGSNPGEKTPGESRDGEAAAEDKKEDEGPGEAAAGSEAMSLGDARVNFESVLRTNASRCGLKVCDDSEEGAETGVTLAGIDRASIEALEGGRYRGAAVFLDAKGARVPVLVTVDFSGPSWRVVELTPRTKKS